ncbi:C_GCAxxG_C_C family protein [Dysgonomonas sp. 216]|uniref:C-GCAxxG-C-C family protein n=1 Tax=Dysgonomonas sp. 216 TaxID=2302934 RepID=UPI0013D77316|nr:C_GCAxxG_C_C family protein [Dysgonomonas sp. 216]
MENRVEKAVGLFKEGYNCSQSVFVAYADVFNLDKDTALKLSCSFGGGIGGMREVCGAVSGMTMLAGLYNGTNKPKDKEGKKVNYDTVQLLANEFKAENGSIICKELLALVPGLPEDKKKKPCVEYVRQCAELVEKHLSNF